VSFFNISFINMLHIGKSIKIKLYGIYQMERNCRVLTQFNKLEIQRRFETQPSIFLIMFFCRIDSQHAYIDDSMIKAS